MGRYTSAFATAGLGVALGCAASDRVSIVDPSAGDTVSHDVLVRLAVVGARVVPATGARVEGEGHHHLFVDVDPTALDQVIPTGAGIYHLGSGVDTVRLTGLAPGPHRLIAVFAYGDHVPIASLRADTVDIVVRP